MSKAGGKTGVHHEVLKTLISRCDGLKSDMDESRGELGALIKDAEETHGINRKAFKLALQCNRMEPDKRADFIRSFRDYCNKLGFNAQLDMFEDDETGETGAEEPADEGAATAKANAEAIKEGIKPTGSGRKRGGSAEAVH
ncbi:hypothetical protein [Methylobacterium nodulans]|uniref:Uncharacterized protein n=1 Tax=Methylobacterium nodulans (strain LMG 21967 / CNCM I-2342 / ORS 2060) TaxID=460265 RepID=B8INW3_METNO|nr:hypothetical protein [Methylobacterium nodulans]ACL58479.1 conserved hypothetical protein [Methylobacterium nodulans ORS 2060]